MIVVFEGWTWGAFGVTDTSNPITPQVHPYAPTTITYSSRYFGGDQYAVIEAPTAFGSINGYSANVLGNGIRTEYYTPTSSDKLNGYFLVALNDYGDFPIINFTQDRFYYTDEFADLSPIYTITGDEVVSWRVYVSGYFSTQTNGSALTYADNVPVFGERSSVLRFRFDDVISGLRAYYGIGDNYPVNSERLTVSVVGYYSDNLADGLNVDMAISKIECEYPYISTFTPRNSYIYFPETIDYITPEPIEPSGLFEWLSDALNGVLTTPLIPIGDYTITIGSIVGMLLGISLVIAFLKFFAGG